MPTLHPAFDWHEVAYLALVSRAIDRIEEDELVPQGLVTYQFSSAGHELGQLLLAQLFDRPLDAVNPYYRSRPFMLSSGLTIEEALASDMARAGSISAGRDVGVVWNMPRRERAMVLPNAADVGSQFTPAAGWAQAITYRVNELGETDAEGSMAVVFGGDGSVASNGFWSALTMATTLNLPLLFVIEDNNYAISVTSPHQTPGANIATNLASFENLKIWDGCGTDPQETATLVFEAVTYVRSGAGPALLRLTVPRLSGHSSVDTAAYKSEEERASDCERDPIPAIRDYLVPTLFSPEAWDELEAQAEANVRAAVEKAQQQPQPDPTRVRDYAYYDPAHPQQVGGLLVEGITPPAGSDTLQPDSPARINMIDAIRRTLDHELGINERMLVFGEDVGVKGGVHAATLGLQMKHGAGRVFDTSLSEEGIIGRAVGMALAGLLPVPEIQFRKYADPATEQINNCGSIRWRTAGRYAAPLVIRIPGGFRKIGDPWHSVCNEIVLAHQVGWQIAFPANAEDAVGLLRTALRGNDPVIFFEHRAMLDASWARRPYPGDDYMLPFGQAKVLTEGDDLTVVTWGAMVERCELAAQTMDAAVEIIDLRTIVPWDQETVLASVCKTARCLIVHEDLEFIGFGAEVAAVIADQAFMYLDAPVIRIGSPSVMVPFNTGLMDAVVPTVDLIGNRMRDLLEF